MKCKLFMDLEIFCKGKKHNEYILALRMPREALVKVEKKGITSPALMSL
jgi:hypothetical protein